MLWAKFFKTDTASPSQAEVILNAVFKYHGYTQWISSTKALNIRSELCANNRHRQPEIGAFAEIPTHDVETIKWSIAFLGLAYIGIQLPAWIVAHEKSSQLASGGDGPYLQSIDTANSFSSKRHFYLPATWRNPINGHCVIYNGYSEAGFTCVSWGTSMTVSEEFHEAYCDEAYGIIPPEVADGSKVIEGLVTERLLSAALPG